MIPPANLAALDQAQAWCEHELSRNVATFRALSAERGESEVLMQAVRELAAWTPRQLGGMLAVAVARLARQEAR